MADVLERLKGDADVVVLDSPPVLPVSDAAVLSGRADITLLVVTAGMTSRRAVARALETLGQVDAPVAGLVLNGVAPQPLYGYNYDDYYYYRRVPFGRRQEIAKQSTYYGRSARRTRNSA
jgi:Mrp family chromosome partitioning ATPase